MGKGAFLLFVLAGLTATVFSNQPPSRFQADKFLDMLARTFDSKVAYLDLLSALQKRLNLDPISNGTTTGAPTPTVTDTPCPEANFQAGATITYTPISRTVGSRAFYECNKGFTGRSLFIQCMPGGQWSPILSWDGCTPVNCGPAPQVANADASATPSTYGSVVIYTCRSGHQMDTQNANLTCQENGKWDVPSFKCDKIPAPQPPANNGMNMAALAAMMAGMSGGEGRTPGAPNPMMAAIRNGMPGMSGFPMMGGGAPGQPTGGNTNIMDMMKMMTAQFQPSPPTTTTTTPAPPAQQNNFQSPYAAGPGGFQLPSHLKSLLPTGLSNAQGFKPQDLIALTSAGLGSSTGGAARPQDISSLLSSMNPMSMLTPGGMGGQSPAGPGGRGRQPVDPEKMAEQREEMMMRAMMATAMKSMMGGGQQQQQGNGTNTGNNNNGMNNMLAMIALQNGLGGAGGGGGGGMDGMFPMMNMMGGGLGGMMGGMGGGAGGLLSGLFGGA